MCTAVVLACLKYCSPIRPVTCADITYTYSLIYKLYTNIHTNTLRERLILVFTMHVHQQFCFGCHHHFHRHHHHHRHHQQ